MQTAEKLRKEIAKSYDSNPAGWSVLVGRDPRNFSQVLISNGSQVWMLKEEWINPYKSVGFGARLPGVNETMKGVAPQDFGLRPLTQSQMEDLVGIMSRGESPKDLFLQIMSSKPVASHDIRSPVVLQGPIMASPNPLSLVSDKHQELDRRLSEELRKLLIKKYPQTVIPYI